MTRQSAPYCSDFAELVEEKQARLKRLFLDNTYVDEASSLSKVHALIAQIGKIDLESEGLDTAENQRDLSIRFHWGHNHRFNDELSVEGRMQDRHLNLMAQFMTKFGLTEDHFTGKDIIDVGCWTGGTTLLLKILGAEKVLALEEVQKYARAARTLICDVYDYQNVICDGVNVYNLEARQEFDIAYFPGVIYHLSDPVLSLRRLFNALKDGGEIFVESEGLDVDEPICRYDGNRIFHRRSNEDQADLNRGGWNWFVPSSACLERWMQEAGFEEIDCFYSPVSRRVLGYGKRNRFVPITKAGFSRPEID